MASETRVFGVTHVAAKFLVCARHTAAGSPTINKIIGISGIVKHSDASNEESGPEDGASVGCLMPPSEYDPWQQFPGTWAVRNNLIFEKPPALSLVHAAALPSVFVRAFSCVCRILAIPPQKLIDELSHGLETEAHSRADTTTAVMIVVGGETPMGSGIIQLLGVARPTIYLLSTIAPMQGMEADVQALSAISIQQVVFGCRYTIDHAAEELKDYLNEVLDNVEIDGTGNDGAGKDKVDVIVDATGDLGDRAEIIVSTFSSQRTRVVRADDLSASAVRAPEGDAGTLSFGESEALETGDGDQLLPLLARLVDRGRFRLPDHLHVTVHSREGFQEANVQATGAGLALVAIDVGLSQ